MERNGKKWKEMELEIMKREEIMETIKTLASSQELYNRLYGELIKMNEDELDEIMTELESQNFKDRVDLVMFIENDVTSLTL